MLPRPPLHHRRATSVWGLPPRRSHRAGSRVRAPTPLPVQIRELIFRVVETAAPPVREAMPQSAVTVTPAPKEHQRPHRQWAARATPAVQAKRVGLLGTPGEAAGQRARAAREVGKAWPAPPRRVWAGCRAKARRWERVQGHRAQQPWCPRAQART